MENNRTRFSKNFVRNIIIASVILILVIVWVIVVASKKTIMIKCAPFEAAVFVDGKRVNNNANHEILSGEHEVMAFLDGFEVYTEKIEINSDTTYIAIELLPINSVGDELMEKYRQDYDKIESYADTEDSKGNQENFVNDPIYGVLPFANSLYGVGYITNPKAAPTLTITAHGLGYIDDAVEKMKELLKSRNINLANYELKINNFESSLGEFTGSAATDPVEFIKEGFKNSKMRFFVSEGKTEGNYFYTTIVAVSGDQTLKVTYRIVLKNSSSNGWSVVAGPYPLLTSKNNPDVPTNILTEVNKMPAIRVDLKNQFDGE